MLRVLDIFSGIGGFSLGLERAGMRTSAFAEIDPYCRAVLKKHWPGVKIYEDVKDVTASGLRNDVGQIDVVAGGFPCQDISYAGRGEGLSGARSGLWWQFHGIIGEVRPRYAIIENVSALRSRGLDVVLGSLAEIGYDAEWHCLPAAAVGAPHRRDRIWIIAYAAPNDDRLRARVARERQKPEFGNGDFAHAVADADVVDGLHVDHINGDGLVDGIETGERGANLADAGAAGSPPPEQEIVLSARRWQEGRAAAERGWWRVEPDVGRVAHGVPRRVDRLKSLGNAVVPQIPEIIGRAIMEHAYG